MNKKKISYKIQYYLSLIPFVGFLIAWIISWINIYRKTNDRKYVFLHFIIWLLPMCIAGGLVALYTVTFMPCLEPILKTVLGIIVSYAACLIMAISCIGISKWIIDRYDSKFIE